MKFAHSEILGLASLLIPALGIFLFWAWRRKQTLVAQFVQSRLLAHLTVGVSQARQKLRLVLLFLAASSALFALARPQWGFSWKETSVQGLDIIVAIDTSKSMLAEDIPPNRLMRAKLAAYDLARIAKSDRFGVIAFAGTAFLQCPLTLDEQAFRQSVEALDVNIIPQGGTAISEAIETAIQAFEKSENHKVLILFTDGEDHDADAIVAAEKAAKADLKLFTIGIGTREGELLRIRDERGNPVFLKDDQGNAVKSRLNENLLQQIATKGNGFYLPLVGTTAMEALYNKGLASLPRGESTSKLVKNYKERYHWFLGLAVVLLLLEIFLPQRRRTNRTAANENTLNLKKVTATLCVIFLPLLAFASPSSAKKKYEAGKFDEAFAEYQKLLAKKTNDVRLHYNAGDAAYRSDQFDVARKHFETATVAPDLELQQKAYYNLGNTLYQLGEPNPDPKEKQQTWEQALKNYENALRLNSEDADAQNNFQFVKQMLEQLKQEQQQQDSGDKQDKNGEKKDQEQQKQDPGQDDQDQEQQKQDSDQKEQDPSQDDKDQQQKEQEQQQAKNQDEEQKKDGQSGEPGEEQEAEEKEGEMAPADGKMTEEQAEQFLEALKRDEKPLIFRPPPKERKNPGQPFKDW
ncbi:MAG: VWA domain-containing protein [Verrucomicrobia bacterium]|nr:VWA domain-containing protein [Verrucomicrobiota bacterium]